MPKSSSGGPTPRWSDVVGFKLGNSGKNVNEEYHATRQRALRETWSLAEWGDIDIEKYDLDELEFSGKDNPRTYIFNFPVADDEIDVSGFDVRDLPNRGER